MKNKFWKFVRDSDTGERILRLEGAIARETWLGDTITPAIFREELNSGDGNISVWINSLGGDVYAAAQIYNMLMDYKGEVTVKIDGIAASAASVVAMAGGTVEISPAGVMMIHDPATVAIGNSNEMQAAIDFLQEIKESIINAYELKTDLPREKISEMMRAETWMNAKKAVELGFADKIMFAEKTAEDSEGMIFSRAAVTNSLLEKFKKIPDNRIFASDLHKRLNLILH